MTKPQPPQVPATMGVAAEQFDAICRKCKDYREYEQRLYIEHRGITHTPELSKINPFEYWREREGYSKKEIADLLGVTLQYYCDVEEDMIMPSIRFIEDFCCILDIHPIDLYFERNQLWPPLLDVLIKSYKEPDEIDVLSNRKKNIEQILKDEADPDLSFFVLSNEYESRSVSDRYENIIIREILEKILLNDGNPLLSGHGSISIFDSELSKLRAKETLRGAAYNVAQKKSKILSEQLDDKAVSLYGREWLKHNSFLSKSMAKYKNRNTVKAIFDLIPPIRNNLPQGLFQEVQGLFFSEYDAKTEMYNKKVVLDLCSQRISILEGFLDDFNDVLMTCDNRQTIIQNISDFGINSMGSPHHHLYLKPVIKNPLIKDLPSPS